MEFLEAEDYPEYQVHKEIPEKMEQRVALVFLEKRVTKAQKVKLVLLEVQGQEAPGEKLDHLDHLVKRVHMDCKEKEVQKEKMDPRV